MRILGIDPGFERLGIAIVDKNSGKKEELVYSECFKTPAQKDFADRLCMLGEKISEIIKKYKPSVLAIETLFLNTNQKTVMKVSEARGVVMYEAKKAGLRIFEVSPPQIKMATTGSGSADKTQVMKMVRLLVSIDTKKNSDDELDAIAVALTAASHLRE